MVKLDQQLIDNAKQVYIHLGLFNKQHSLTTTELDKLPVEIQKMNLLYCTDPAELTKVVRQFLQTSQRARRKSTLNDFIRAIDGAFNSICAGADGGDDVDDWDDNDLDGVDRDDATTTTENDSISKKRLLEESNGAPNKRLHTQSLSTSTTSGKANPDSSDTPLTDDAEYPKLLYQLQLQKDNIKFKGFNVIASPPDPLAIIKQAPMIFQVELARFMTSCCIPWHHLDLDTAQKFLDLARNNPGKVHDVMMAWYSDFRGSGTSRVPLNDRLWNLLSLERCSESVWKYGMNSTSSDTDTPRGDIMTGGKMVLTKSLRFTANIHLPDNKDELPTIQLNIPRVQSSNRFFRKFGAERFLELRLSKVLAPEAISEHTSYILRPFLLMGRTYRFLFIKDGRLVLFATEGPGLTPISLHSVINWHIPIIDNWSLTTCKFASRMSLGYSNSISTLQFEPENVRYIDDVFAPGRPRDDNSCMTDGCGIISASAMRKIMCSQQNDILPCAIQGRIGGAKGLWIVSLDLDMDSGDWIEIRSSQKKFKTGLPDHMLADKLDPIHFTFDLVKNAFCIYPSHLNTQFIQCLAAGGVPVQVFIELLTEHIGNVSDILTDIKNTQVLRDWLVRSGGVQGQRRTGEGLGKNEQGRQAAPPPPQPTVVDDDHDDRGKSGGAADDHDTSGATSKQSGVSPINPYSGFPSNLYESIVRLLDAGFDLTNAYIANRTTSAFRGMLVSLSTKYRVEVQQSCTLMCIPDPSGLLKPNEVFLQLSNRRIDEKTGIHAGLITGDILVSRNPCGLKSDFQKVQAVDCSALRVYSDVIVFPTQGARSLASKLSGGDYDGDLIFCCWDRRMVEPFSSCPVPDTHPRLNIVFERDSRKVRDELWQLGNDDDYATRLQQLFLTVPTYDGTLGVYENWRTVVSEMDSFGTDDGIYLSQMCALLVDAPKQGYKLKLWAKKDDRAKYANRPVPTWFLEKLKKTRDTDDGQPARNPLKPADRPLTTAMDFLHFAIQQEIEKLAKTPQSLIPEELVTRKDNDLALPWNKAVETAKALGDEAMQADLETIRDAVEVNFNNYMHDIRDVVNYLAQKADSQWTSTRSQMEGGKTSSVKENGPGVLGECINRFSSFLQIEHHYAKVFHEMAMDSLVSTTLKMDIMVNDGRLVQTLKGSYAYLRTVTKDKYNKYCYVVAYDVLARIKSDVCAKKSKLNGICNTVVPSIYPALHMDRRWIRKYKDIRLLGK